MSRVTNIWSLYFVVPNRRAISRLQLLDENVVRSTLCRFRDAVNHFIKHSQRGALISTHNVEEAKALCPRLAIMVNGQLRYDKSLPQSDHFFVIEVKPPVPDRLFFLCKYSPSYLSRGQVPQCLKTTGLSVVGTILTRRYGSSLACKLFFVCVYTVLFFHLTLVFFLS